MAKKLTSTVIDHEQEFPQLARPPIVEAVVEWRAEPTATIDFAELRVELERVFPDAAIQPLRHLHATLADGEHGIQVSETSTQAGFRIACEDGRIVCQMRSNGVAVSRLEPYTGWDDFLPKAQSFLRVFLNQFKPTHYSRLGVRSISKVTVLPGETVHNVMKGTATPWKDFGFESSSFFHQDAVRWPKTDYGVRLVRAMDPGEPGEGGVLFLDVDISLEEAVDLGEVLKNLVFFSTVRNPKKRFGVRR
jgi:uncharacterized protein (TIGR04255 family)